jgi:DNA-binding response OmpR family regulator
LTFAQTPTDKHPLNRPLSLLLIEDNTTIATQVVDFLKGLGWTVDYAGTGKEGISLANNQSFDVILLDLNLPDIDGLQVCQKIRSTALKQPPILMLTARDAFSDKREGYGAGADDYVTKPFDLRELALKCEALSRRFELHHERQIEIGDLCLNLNAGEATRAQSPLKLTRIGYRILEYLARAYPKAVSRSDLSHHLWGDDPPETDALRSHIYHLRSVLDKPFDLPMLKTLSQVGFRLEITDNEAAKS